ncbi:MAG: hydrogenase maturation nickel metallochaperone HypA [Desulfobulbaceae bacterium]|nr:hydrogenase maturation nickel metallochaperone HypA [Desulfobulbaceae bacterium]
MHEFSLAQGLYTQLLQLADTHRAARIVKVRVEIGRLSGVVADSFSFGFEILTQENELTRGAILDITQTEAKRTCPDCGYIYPAENAETKLCPQCGSSDFILTGGDDLILTQVEME